MASYLESPSDQRRKKIAQAGLKPQAEKLLQLLTENPYATPPPYEKLVGNLQGFYSRRISIQHRLVYRVVETKKWFMFCGCGLIMNNHSGKQLVNHH